MKAPLTLLLFLFAGFVLQSCAQTKDLVVRKQGFFMLPSAGTIAVEGAQEVWPAADSVFLLFVETRPGEVRWEQAWTAGRSFSVIPEIIKQTKLTVGQTKQGSENVEFSPAPGNVLWKLELSDDQQKNEAPQQVSKNEVLLKGLQKNKAFYVRIKPLTELASPRYQ